MKNTQDFLGALGKRDADREIYRANRRSKHARASWSYKVSETVSETTNQVSETFDRPDAARTNVIEFPKLSTRPRPRG